MGPWGRSESHTSALKHHQPKLVPWGLLLAEIPPHTPQRNILGLFMNTMDRINQLGFLQGVNLLGVPEAGHSNWKESEGDRGGVRTSPTWA